MQAPKGTEMPGSGMGTTIGKASKSSNAQMDRSSSSFRTMPSETRSSPSDAARRSRTNDSGA